jgi:hypothetical protein
VSPFDPALATERVTGSCPMWSTSVALYVFDIYNGEQIRDEIGTEC